jgi:Uma2 family endonuclease
MPEQDVPPGIVMRGVAWSEYEDQLRIIGERRIFVNYDRGVMEVLMPSRPHEKLADFLALTVDVLCEELDIPNEAGGSTTHRREDLEKGVEPDRCYWLGASALAMVGTTDLDLNRDPPPSLAIEVSYTSSSVDRMAIYAALGVEEVWRYREQVEFLVLENGTFRPINASCHFPDLDSAGINRELETFCAMGRLDWVRGFRQYVRENLIPPAQEF